MGQELSLRETLRRRATERAGGLTPEQREQLLVGSWMSHDARWFNAVAGEYGMAVANTLNKRAAYELGRVEARRIAAAAQLSDVATRDGYLLAQETIIGVLGPNLLAYDLALNGDDGYEVRVQRCFAADNVSRAGIAQQYECGIFARVTGWMDGLGITYAMSPCLGPCMQVQGRQCVYAFTLTPPPTG